jgi:hypothetical protein
MGNGENEYKKGGENVGKGKRTKRTRKGGEADPGDNISEEEISRRSWWGSGRHIGAIEQYFEDRGRLLDYVSKWRETCGGELLLRNGFQIALKSLRGKNLIEQFGPKKKECWQQGKEREAMREAVLEGLRSGTIEEIPSAEVKLASPSYVVPKAKGGYRQVLDLRLLNSHVREIKFKMEDTLILKQLAREGDFATSLDIKSAFNHVLTNPSALPYLTFYFDGKSYTWKGMPFGAKHSPLIFTKLMKIVLKYIREKWKVRCIGYMDDLLFLHENQEELGRITQEIADYLEWIGWILSKEKCELVPKQQICFLGWIWDFQTMEVKMKKERRESLMKLLRKWLGKSKETKMVKNRDLAALLGKVNFLRMQFPRMSLYTVRLNQAKVKGVKWTGWNGKTRLTKQQSGELKVLLRWIKGNVPKSISVRVPEATLTTDACQQGWGATLILGTYTLLYHGDFKSWKYPLTSSNQRETAAVLLAMRTCQAELRREKVRCLCIESDNSTTVSNLAKKRGAKSMVILVRRIFLIAEKMDMELVAKHRPGVENETADALSRLKRAGDYYLREEVFQRGLQKIKEERDISKELDQEISDALKAFAEIYKPLIAGSL